MKPVEILPVGNILGEGVTWDAQTQSLWWTDIQARQLYRYDWQSKAIDRFTTPERLCSFGFVEGSGKLIAAFESGFALYDPQNSTVVWLARPQSSETGIRFNDGRVDRQGRFWAGTMAETADRASQASLYCLDGDGIAHQRESRITISNGICWSPDSRRFYFADSPRGMIYLYDFDAGSGAISGRRLFATTDRGASPDGANVDSQGYLWSAHWGAGRVVRYAPDGHIDRVLDVPASQPTCIAFGGPDLDILFVTSAREGLSEEAVRSQSGAGHLFVYNIGIAGLPDGRYKLDAANESSERNYEAEGAKPESYA